MFAKYFIVALKKKSVEVDRVVKVKIACNTEKIAILCFDFVLKKDLDIT